MGVFQLILAFGLKYWKYIAIIMVVVSAFFLVQHKITSMKEEAYKNGVQDEKTHVIGLIKAENDRNRKFESQLQIDLNAFGDNFDKQKRERIVRETVYRDRLVHILENDPTGKCPTNPQVTAVRNDIRHSMK